jgi:uncharacterized protein YndB with AHSA1/START domain
MHHFRHALTLAAPTPRVYEALTTDAGIRGWWTPDCHVGSAEGERLSVRFDQRYKVMRIASLQPTRHVAWQCVEAHLHAPGLVQRTDEWLGTTITFDLHELPGRHTRLTFQHRGLTPAAQCFDLCSDGWRHFLASLQSYVETDLGHPYVPQLTAPPTPRQPPPSQAFTVEA